MKTGSCGGFGRGGGRSGLGGDIEIRPAGVDGAQQRYDTNVKPNTYFMLNSNNKFEIAFLLAVGQKDTTFCDVFFWVFVNVDEHFLVRNI